MSSAQDSAPRSSKRRTESLFLVQLLRRFCGGADVELTPPTGLSWGDLTDLLDRHGLIPQMASRLPELASRLAMPEAVRADLEQRNRDNALLHLFGVATLRDAHSALASAGVSYVAIKGPVLSQRLYEDLALRSYCDIDVLVRRRDLEKALEALEDASYTRLDRPRKRGAFFRKAFDRRIGPGSTIHELLLPSRESRLKIELHWSLVDRANLVRIPEEDIFAGRSTVHIVGLPIPALAPEMELLYLCLHLLKHGPWIPAGLRFGCPAEWFCRPNSGYRIASLIDLHTFLRSHADQLDWDAMRLTVQRWNADNAVQPILDMLALLVRDGVAEDCQARLGLRQLAQHKPGAGPHRRVDNSLGRRLLERLMAMSGTFLRRPIRILFLLPILLPSPRRLRRFYSASHLPLAILYLLHPLYLYRRMLTSRGAPD